MDTKKTSRTSVHSHRVDKMGGSGKDRLRMMSSTGKSVIKKSAKAKRRRFLKIGKDE